MKEIENISITNEEAIVLQQISENGEDDIVSLSQGLRMSRNKVLTHLAHLRMKGLITVKATYDDWWVHISRRGQRVVHYMWPELPMAM